MFSGFLLGALISQKEKQKKCEAELKQKGGYVD